jgi:FixJ family two-component response regulator
VRQLSFYKDGSNSGAGERRPLSYSKESNSMDVDGGISQVHLVFTDPHLLKDFQLMIEKKGYDSHIYQNVKAFLAAQKSSFLSNLRNERACLIVEWPGKLMTDADLLFSLNENDYYLPLVLVCSEVTVKAAAQVLHARAVDILEKPVRAERLLESTHLALSLCKMVSERRHTKKIASVLIQKLTQRERDVFNLIIRGVGNKNIALELAITQRTVESHRARIMKKTKCSSLADLVCVAMRAGVIS